MLKAMQEENLLLVTNFMLKDKGKVKKGLRLEAEIRLVELRVTWVRIYTITWFNDWK